MLDYKLWQDRLISQLGSSVKKVGFSDSVKSVLANANKATPSLHVIPRDERGVNLHTTGRSGSMVTAGVDIVIIAKDSSDAVGGQVTKNIKVISDLVDSALMGWTPSDANQPIFFRSSKRIAMYKGLLVWAQTYDTKYIKV
jgi:hypothetical protein